MTHRGVITFSDDEEPQDDLDDSSYQVLDEPPESSASRPKRTSKASDKQKMLDKENLETKMKKFEALQKEIKKLKRQGKEQEKATTKKGDEDDDENEIESEEETINHRNGFSTAVQPLSAISIQKTRGRTPLPLKCVGAAAAKTPAPVGRVSANTFRSLKSVSASSDVAVHSDDGVVIGVSDSESLGLSPNTLHVSKKRPQSARSPSPVPTSTKKHKTSTANATEGEPRFRMPAYREGVEVNAKKPKAADYEDVVHALILRAASEYESLVSTKDAFPDTALRNKWAWQAWKNAGADAGESYEITDRINSLLRKHGSRIRGHAVQSIRPLVATVFGFKRGSDAKTAAANRDLFTRLKNHAAFHYKDPTTLSGYAGGKIISESLHAVWFDSKTSHGIIFEKLFNPIPFETLALIMTIVDFCLDEWSSGIRVKSQLWEKDVIERHKIFVKDLKNWDSLNTVVVKGIRKKLYIRGCRNAGVEELITAKEMLTGEVMDRVRNELEGRTGETDSELED